MAELEIVGKPLRTEVAGKVREKPGSQDKKSKKLKDLVIKEKKIPG